MTSSLLHRRRPAPSLRRSRVPARPVRVPLAPPAARAVTALPGLVTVHVCASTTVTPTSWAPVAPAPSGRSRRLALPAALVQRLGSRLPAPWVLAPEDDPLLDVAVTTDGAPEHVRAVLHAHPGSTVLAVVPYDAPAEVVVDLLEAGADGCLRDGDAREVLAHLQALDRRTRAA